MALYCRSFLEEQAFLISTVLQFVIACYVTLSDTDNNQLKFFFITWFTDLDVDPISFFSLVFLLLLLFFQSHLASLGDCLFKMNTNSINRFRCQLAWKYRCTFSVSVPNWSEACVNCESVNSDACFWFTITSDHVMDLIVKVNVPKCLQV